MNFHLHSNWVRCHNENKRYSVIFKPAKAQWKLIQTWNAKGKRSCFLLNFLRFQTGKNLSISLLCISPHTNALSTSSYAINRLHSAPNTSSPSVTQEMPICPLWLLNFFLTHSGRFFMVYITIFVSSKYFNIRIFPEAGLQVVVVPT